VSVDAGLESAGAAPDRTQGQLPGTRFSAELWQHLNRRRAPLQLWGGLTADRSWQPGSPQGVAAAGAVNGSIVLTRRMHLDIHDRLSSAPLDLFGAAGGDATTPPPVLSGSEIAATRTLTHTAGATLTRVLGLRTTVSLSATNTLALTGRDRVVTSGTSGVFVQQVSRFTSWRTAYGLTASSSNDAAAAVVNGLRHDFEIGVQYGRPLPLWGGTNVSATVGAAFLADVQARGARVDAAAHLDHRVSARWSLVADYARPVEYIAGVAQPLVSDTFRGELSGVGPWRVAMAVGADAGAGSVGVGSDAHFANYSARARFSRRLGQAWQLEVTVHNSWYRFDTPPGVGIPAAYARRGVRTALVWAAGR